MDWLLTIAMWILWGILGLLAVTLLILNLPYRAELRAAWDEERLDARAWGGLPLRLSGAAVFVSFERQQFSVYLLGLRLFSRPLGALKRSIPGEKSRRKEAAGGGKRTPSGRWRQALHAARSPYKTALLRRIPRWLFLRAALEARVGFDDPYTAGQVEGALLLIKALFPGLGQTVAFTYTESSFEGRIRVSMIIWLPRIAAGLFVFLMQREGRAVLRHFLRRPRPTRRAA